MQGRCHVDLGVVELCPHVFELATSAVVVSSFLDPLGNGLPEHTCPSQCPGNPVEVNPKFVAESVYDESCNLAVQMRIIKSIFVGHKTSFVANR